MTLQNWHCVLKVASIVGDFGYKDTSIQVTGLKAGHYYNIRVIATNPANFSSLGPLIRLRTIPSKGGDEPSKEEEDEASDRLDECEAAGIRAGRSQFGSPVQIPVPQAAKEASAAQTNSRRTMLGRRVSPVINITEPPSLLSSRATSVDEDDSDEAILRLTEQLHRLRGEQHETNRQVEDEDLAHLASIADLFRDRDNLRQELKEKEDLMAELKRHGGHLEKINRAAQNRKHNKERILQQKKTERQRIHNDIARWKNEMGSMRQESEHVAREKERVKSTKDGEIVAIRRVIIDDHEVIKNLEDDIRATGVQIKSMEQDREHCGRTGADEQQDDHAWESRAQAMQAQLSALWQTLQQVSLSPNRLSVSYYANESEIEIENQQAQDRLAYWNTQRSRDPDPFAALPTPDYPLMSRPTRVRRQRQVGNRANAASLPFGGHHNGPFSVPYNPAIASHQFPSASPFFNMSNGMAVLETIGPQISEQFGQSVNDSEILTSGGLMSPAANDLLPSNLFRDEDTEVHESPTAFRKDSFSGGPMESIETQSNPTVDNPNTDRRTPGSTDSRRGSLLSSPHGSVRNFHSGQSSVDAFADNDRLSTRSTSASMLQNTAPESNPLITSRLAQFFPTFNRQRGKSGTREPPALGTLKQGQSQSFPRNLDQDPVNALETRHRRGSYGNWSLPMAGLLNRTGTAAHEVTKDSSVTAALNAATPRHRLNMFGPRVDTEEASALAERSSSRPSSMYSFDQLHGRPSSDSQRLNGWPVAENTPSRGSPLNANWSTPGGIWSRAPSRRPSVQRGSTSNLSLGSTPLDSEPYDGVLAPARPEQQPIGTRPRSSQRFSAAKLNPAAPTFRTIFGRSEARKAAKAERANEKAAEKERVKDAERASGDDTTAEVDESLPSQPRQSRDAGSITTAGSTAESHDSLENSTSGATSEATPSSGTRESFMQKITRKSSSSKFNVPWGKERGGLFSRRTEEPSTPDELDEDVAAESRLVISGDSVTGMPQQERGSRTSLSWPNMRRKSKKGGLTVEKGAETADDDEF